MRVLYVFDPLPELAYLAEVSSYSGELLYALYLNILGLAHDQTYVGLTVTHPLQDRLSMLYFAKYRIDLFNLLEARAYFKKQLLFIECEYA